MSGLLCFLVFLSHDNEEKKKYSEPQEECVQKLKQQEDCQVITSLGEMPHHHA